MGIMNPTRAGPNTSKLASWPSQPSPAAKAMTCALESIGTASKSKLARVLPGGRRASARWRSMRRRSRSASSCSASAARKRAAGQPSLPARRSAVQRPVRLRAGTRAPTPWSTASV